MEYNFEKFVAVNSRYEDRLSITSGSSIGLPTRFCDDNGIKQFKFALLYWDPKEKALGIRFTNDEKEKGKFTVVHSKNNYGAMISARSFFKHYRIDTNTTKGKYPPEKVVQNDIGDLFVIKLNPRGTSGIAL